MLDDRNRELAEVTQPDDLIVSDRLASLMISPGQREPIAHQTCSSSCSPVAAASCTCVPPSWYVRAGAESRLLHEWLQAAAETSERLRSATASLPMSTPADKSYGVHLNPPKQQRLSFAPGDSVILLAEQA